jgi:endoglucanase
MEASGDGPIDQAEWNKFLNWMNDRELSWIAWSVSDKVETCSVLNPSAASNGDWKPGDVKDWGNITKEALRKY